MTSYKRINDDTLKVTDDLAEDNDWGSPRLTRLFNFRAQQVTTIYERGGVATYAIPRPGGHETGRAPAVTSSMAIQKFSELDDTGEIAAMHAKLQELKGNPPPLDEILPNRPLDKPRAAGLK